jgi:P-type conjugative transfer protein TrbG
MMRIVAGVVMLATVSPVDVVMAQTDSASADPVIVAMTEAQRGWSARTVRTGDAVVFPYGRVQPMVTCAPLRACVIELEPGETVLGEASGDAERWLIDRTATGVRGKTVLVVVKPTACSLTTNLVLSTDRRVYDLSLVSAPCTGPAGGPTAEYTRFVRFYYPDPLIAGADSGVGASRSRGDESRPERLRFEYVVHADKHVRWAPVAVYDDGAHTYLRFAEYMARGPLPVLRALSESGTPALMNYTVEANAFITDRVIDRAELVMGDERSRRVEIVRMPPANP